MKNILTYDYMLYFEAGENEKKMSSAITDEINRSKKLRRTIIATIAICTAVIAAYVAIQHNNEIKKLKNKNKELEITLHELSEQMNGLKGDITTLKKDVKDLDEAILKHKTEVTKTIGETKKAVGGAIGKVKREIDKSIEDSKSDVDAALASIRKTNKKIMDDLVDVKSNAKETRSVVVTLRNKVGNMESSISETTFTRLINTLGNLGNRKIEADVAKEALKTQVKLTNTRQGKHPNVPGVEHLLPGSMKKLITKSNK